MKSDIIMEDKNKKGSNHTTLEVQNDPGKMFIGGLHSQTTEGSLQDYFGTYGEIVETLVMRDPVTKRSSHGLVYTSKYAQHFIGQRNIVPSNKNGNYLLTGFGFVTFKDVSSVDTVLAVHQTSTGHIVDGKKVDPKRAVPKKNPNQLKQFKKVFLGGISGDTSSGQIREYFETFGKVTEVLLMYDRETKRNRGFGFVTFESEEVAKAVCEEGFHKINNKNVSVYQASGKPFRGRQVARNASAFFPARAKATVGITEAIKSPYTSLLLSNLIGVECKRAQPKEVMLAIQGRGRGTPFAVGFSPFVFTGRGFTPGFGFPVGFGFGPEWGHIDPQMYQQLTKYDGYAQSMAAASGGAARGRARTRPGAVMGFPGGSSYPGYPGFMTMPDNRRQSSQQYPGEYTNIQSTGVRTRSDHPGSSTPNPPVSNVQEYDYGVQASHVSQYNPQHAQHGNLGPPPSPLTQTATSPGPEISYITSARASGHDYSVYSAANTQAAAFGGHGIAPISLRQ